MNEKKKKASKFSLLTIKSNSLELFRKGQLPYKLTYYINKLNKDSDIEVIKELKRLCEHYLRVSGYYAKYPNIHKKANEEIEKDVNAFL